MKGESQNAVRQAVIDIGSNAIRLVVYAGAARAPMPIYNEKSRVSLGTCLAGSGRIDEESMAQALAAIARFHTLARAMDIDALRVVATAATREASNGHELVERAAAIGIRIEILDGMTEAYVAGLGIISDHPQAEGYVGDLGGGSLELARISNGEIGERISLPFGTLRIGAMVEQAPKEIAQILKTALADAGIADSFPVNTGLPFFLVGGSWRALARLHIHISEFPLAVLSNYAVPPESPAELLPLAKDRKALVESKAVPSSRIDSLAGAAALLTGIVRLLKPSTLITSTSGLREGLLFDRLSADERRRDPLVEAARHEGARLARFRFHGDALADWIDPLFAHQGADMARLRRVACLLADTAWNMTPEYRADVALTLALDGAWPGATAEDRAILAAALIAVHESKSGPAALLEQLAPPDKLHAAKCWGLAIRLAQRLDGGTGVALADSQLSIVDETLELCLSGQSERLQSESLVRRLQKLGEAIGCSQTQIITAS
jgi:exopolyphosphatase / guanosine-5'-triphosphate,3'-diphosphate pyrophosphatase